MFITILVILVISFACYFGYKRWKSTANPVDKIRKDAERKIQNSKKGSKDYIRGKEAIRVLDEMKKY
tara:strand:- start:61 stop:261 length:201 start_codon:yes stop_codon:yes gene_type:complete